MNAVQKGFIAFGAAITLVFGGGYIADIFLHKIPSIQSLEGRRVQEDHAEITKVKCIDPKQEFIEAETKYLVKYSLLFEPQNKYDVLDGDEVKESKQFTDANELKILDDLAVISCAEAKLETVEMKKATTWNYFKSNWKKVMFNAE